MLSKMENDKYLLESVLFRNRDISSPVPGRLSVGLAQILVVGRGVDEAWRLFSHFFGFLSEVRNQVTNRGDAKSRER